MDFTPTHEHLLLGETVRDLLSRHAPLKRVRELTEASDPGDPEIWARLVEADLTAMLVPEEDGGLGLGLVDVEQALVAMGAALMPGPFFASCVAATLVLVAAERSQLGSRLLQTIADGSAIVTVAWGSGVPSGRRPSAVVARRTGGDSVSLDGLEPLVLAGESADWIVVPALIQESDDLLAVAVPAAAPGLRATPVPMPDGTRRYASVNFDRVEAPREQVIGTTAPAALDRAGAGVMVALAAEMIGGAAHVLRMAVTYAHDRRQFGRPIGSFQAIQHQLADVLVDLESAISGVQHGVWAYDRQLEDVAVAAAVAKAAANRAYVRAAERSVHTHGGIGFTWEHDAHLYLRRALTDAAVFGGDGECRAVIGQGVDALLT